MENSESVSEAIILLEISLFVANITKEHVLPIEESKLRRLGSAVHRNVSLPDVTLDVTLG